MGNFWKCSGKCSQECSGKSDSSAGCFGGIGGAAGSAPESAQFGASARGALLGALTGAPPMPLSTLRSTPRSGAIPEISYLALLRLVVTIETLSRLKHLTRGRGRRALCQRGLIKVMAPGLPLQYQNGFGGDLKVMSPRSQRTLLTFKKFETTICCCSDITLCA